MLRRIILFLPAAWIGLATVTAAPTAAVWRADVPGGQPALVHQLVTQVRAAGYQIRLLDSVALTNVTRLRDGRIDLLVLPDARHLPVAATRSLLAYLRAGHDLLALGLPAWRTPVFRLQGRWWTRARYEAALVAQRPTRRLIDFAHENLARWTRQTNRPGRPAERELVRTDHTVALHVTMGALDGWDTLEAPARDFRFPAHQTLTCFEAKGNAATHQLALEWDEQDGSRWIATVDLKTNWQRYALPPQAFKPWQPPPGRGGPGDHLNVHRVTRFTVGLALTHTSVGSGKLEYWFADLGTASNPFGDTAPPVQPKFPRIESFSPAYQCFSVHTPVWVKARSILAEPKSGSGAAGAGFLWQRPLLGLNPRPSGVGFGQNRPWRWEPLVAAYDHNSNDYRGAVAALLVQRQPPFRGGVWAVFTPADPRFYAQPAARRWLSQTLRAMRRGVFLVEGGSQFFALFPKQAVPLGATVRNCGPLLATNLTVRFQLNRLGRVAHQLVHDEALTAVPPGGKATVRWNVSAARWPYRRSTVRVELLQDGHVRDRLEHPIQRWEPKRHLDFVTAHDGGLWWHGKPWKANGVNYMPSSGIGVVNSYFEYWLGKGAYDPEVIERDLERIKAMGLNAVSVFIYYRSLHAQNLLDFLLRCERLGLKVNLSLRPGTPMDFRWHEMREIIEFYRLAQNDTVFAYDLAWEPSHYNHAYQQAHYARLWQAWVRRAYGSVAAAQRAWGSPAPRAADGSLAVPPMTHLTHDGPWRKVVADYRAFLDGLLGRHYAAARRLVKSVDPHHLVSFRMQLAGDPTFNQNGLLPYDFYGLRHAVDLWEPEAYGRIGNWDQVKAGEFTAAYARLCDPNKPLIWAEMGDSVWDRNRGAPGPERLAFAARFYRDFYRMLCASGADGVFFWWYPGGYRVNERSDYGIINPDGTDRSVTRVIRAEGPKFLAAPKPGSPTRWLDVDRDRDARGLFGIYAAVKAKYWQEEDAGQRVGLRWTKPPRGPTPQGAHIR